MPAYIEKFTDLSEADQQKELERKVASTSHTILDTPPFPKDVKKLTGTDRLEWDVDETKIRRWWIDEAADKVYVDVAIRVARSELSVAFNPEPLNEVSDEIRAVIDDDGELKYDPVQMTKLVRSPQKPVQLVVPAPPPKKTRNRFPRDSEEWIAQHANLDWWLPAQESNAWYQNFSNKYHVQINEFDSGWAYTIMPYGRTDTVLDHDDGYNTMEDVIDAALRALVKLWNGVS